MVVSCPEITRFHRVCFSFRQYLRRYKRIECPASGTGVERGRRLIIGQRLALCCAGFHMPADTVLQLFAKCQFNHSAERIGAVFRSGLRDNLDAHNVGRTEITQIIHQFFAFDLQFAFVDKDFGTPCPVDGNTVPIDPYARSQLQDFDRVFIQGQRHIVHPHHEAVGLACDR